MNTSSRDIWAPGFSHNYTIDEASYLHLNLSELENQWPLHLAVKPHI
jgi:hypothetical protein